MERILEAYGERITELERRIVDRERIQLPKQLCARVYNSADISIVTATGTPLTFDSEDYDTYNFHSTSVNTGRITIPYAGKYRIGFNGAFESNATGYRQAFLFKNAATVIAQDTKGAVNGEITSLTLVTEYNFALNDYIQVYVYQNSGGNKNLLRAADYSAIFWIDWIPK